MTETVITECAANAPQLLDVSSDGLTALSHLVNAAHVLAQIQRRSVRS